MEGASHAEAHALSDLPIQMNIQPLQNLLQSAGGDILILLALVADDLTRTYPNFTAECIHAHVRRNAIANRRGQQIVQRMDLDILGAAIF
jgi:hypothetical protein